MPVQAGAREKMIMGRAVAARDASGQHDPFKVDEGRALEALRLAWGDAYEIGFESDAWIATSRDAEARAFTADTPDALNAKIRADWAREGTL
jgi:hypothetical protein